jgi:AcrR family transcriptional regulator
MIGSGTARPPPRVDSTGATTERIAAEAGVSRVTLHRRGETKDGLLRDLVGEATDDYRRAMWPALTGGGRLPPRERQRARREPGPKSKSSFVAPSTWLVWPPFQHPCRHRKSPRAGHAYEEILIVFS